MQFDRIGDMARQFGADSVFLVGGALLAHTDSVRDSTALYLDAIREHFEEELVNPRR